ncbi:MAG: GCN5-like N-acetyltransferase [Chloroflexi bacterium]|nr:MAG: GCN5-like N-acetyltransferase [Chloroflexota bacterium]MBA4375555.1 GNAT family N-acetyltransferase [Anaerolinea sp.]
MTYQITEMTAKDYDEAYSLWQHCAGIGLSDADERCAITRFLKHNPGLCFVARKENTLVGTCLCGSDGRRGYLYHLAVDPAARRQGIGKDLVEHSFETLMKGNIHKCHIMVYGNNELGLAFWKQSGWKLRPEIVIMSYDLEVPKKDTPC